MKKTISAVAALCLLTTLLLAEQNDTNQTIKDANQTIDANQTKNKPKDLQANIDNGSEKLKNFLSKTIFSSNRVKVRKVIPVETQGIENADRWTALFSIVDMDIDGKNTKQPMTFFVKNDIFAKDIYNMKTGENYSNTMKPSLPKNIYKESKLFAGNAEAKTKVVIFSDPLCPFCKTTMSEFYMAAKTYPDEIALYYYSIPIVSIHPASVYLSAAIELKRENGDNNFLLEAYNMNLSPNSNVLEVFNAIKEQTKDTNITSSNELLDVKYQNTLIEDQNVALRCAVVSTPTVYINGKHERKTNMLENIIGKDKVEKIRGLLTKKE